MQAVLEFIYFSRRGVWGRAGASDPEWPRDVREEEADTQLRESIRTLGAEGIWSGSIPKGVHGRLVACGMTESSASQLLRNLAREARKACKSVWSARCTWVNAAETRTQTRNRWREAFKRVARRWALLDTQEMRIHTATVAKFYALWGQATKAASDKFDEQELELKVAAEMRRITDERGEAVSRLHRSASRLLWQPRREQRRGRAQSRRAGESPNALSSEARKRHGVRVGGRVKAARCGEPRFATPRLPGPLLDHQ